jgi:hypothetical protein
LLREITEESIQETTIFGMPAADFGRVESKLLFDVATTGTRGKLRMMSNTLAPDPKRLVVCFDEGAVQIIGEVRQPIPG